MSKLCYKVNGAVKKYDLKDSVSGTPKLGVKIGGSTKYLGLKQGTKSGELSLKFNGHTYYVQTAITIGNAKVNPGAYSQTIRDWGTSSDDDRIMSWIFSNQSNNQIMAMIVFAHTEGHGMGVVQHLSSEYTGISGTSSGTNYSAMQQNDVFGQRFSTSSASALSGNIKIGLVKSWGYGDVTTKVIHDYLVDSARDESFYIYDSSGGGTVNSTIFNRRDNSVTSSRSATGKYYLPIYDPACSGTSPSLTLKTSSSNLGDWFINDSPFSNVSVPYPRQSRPAVSYSSVWNFLVGLYNGYPIIEMGSVPRTHRTVLAYIEFPYSGYTGVAPYDFIDAWYDLVGDRTYPTTSWNMNNSIITYTGDSEFGE